MISTVEYYNFTINGDPQDHYKGVYKNGLPYDGFFKNQVMLDDIYLIDFYEKGKKKYQYSFDFLNQMDNYKHYILDIKSTYKNDKIFDGSEFLKPTKNGLVRLNYSSGKLNKVEVNLFAMHYFNRINFEQSKNEILINEMQSAYNVKVSTKNKQQIAQLFDDKKLISTTSPLEEVKLGTPLSKTFYYLDQEQIKTYSIKIQDFGHVDTNELVFRIFAMFPMNYSSQDEVMNHFAKIFSKEDLEESFMSDSEYIFPFKKEDLLSTLDYDDKGKIGFGIKVTREKDGKYLIEGMEDNKVLESIRVNSVEELRRDQNKIISDLMYRILNN